NRTSTKVPLFKHVRIYNEINKKLFRSMLLECSWLDLYECPIEDVNKQWKTFMSIFVPIFEHCFPLKLIKIRQNKLKYYSNCPMVSEYRRQLDLLSIISKHDVRYCELYREIKQRYDKALINARKNHYGQLIKTAENKSKAVWQIVNNI